MSTAAALGTAAVAGCLGGTGENEGEPDEETGNDVSEADRDLAAEMVDAVDDDLSVTDWEVPGMFILDYANSGGVEADAPILGSGYADIADRGFDRRAMPTALLDDGSVDFMVFIEPEWARSYLEGEWSEAEYYARIVDSEH
ncbi:hypothetical protein [Natrinema marinum]|uniref:hypothetical protein n=1 Tax=Natrinema marinum TaxID=2961598 RepID=UPI0020C91559|nr:hypothetical protein [Natrinema marinum]